MTNCTESLERLPLYVGGELEALEAARVAEHLRLCGPCSQEELALQEARELFRDAVRAPASELSKLDLWSAVRASMLSEGLLSAPLGSQENQWELRPVASTAVKAPKLSLLRQVASFASAAAVIGLASLAASGLLNTSSGDASKGVAFQAGNHASTRAASLVEGEALMSPVLPGEVSLSMNSKGFHPNLRQLPIQTSFPMDPSSALAGYPSNGLQHLIKPGAAPVLELR